MHRKHKPTQPTETPQLTGTLSCNVETCPFVGDTLTALCAHLRIHIRDGKKVCCPFDGCSKYFRVRTSFASHISRKHTQALRTHILSASEENQTEADVSIASLEDQERNEECIDRDSFLHDLALFYLKMHAKLQLPATTTQMIIEGFQHVHTSNLANFFDKLRGKLLELGISEMQIDRIINDLSSDDLITQYNKGPLRSDKTRKTFFKQHFDYTEPRQLYLGTDAVGRERFCQYVPIKDTLQTLLKQTSVQTGQARRNNGDPMILQDVTDGKNYQENSLQSTPSLSLILYQDSFEVANPLGSGKKKHKVLAVYLTLAEIEPHNRSLVDPMQLVLLCRDNDFKTFEMEKVFSDMIADLKDLEDEGIITDDGNRIKTCLISICGDNLGSHCIGGFSENFSHSAHFCRYCLIARTDFKKNPLKLGLKRTIRGHEETVKQLSTTGEPIAQGVKFDSPFNTLKHFHVCTGLPPCLGHDLFEGVVSYDLALYINYLVKEKHFTYAQLNRSIAQFKYLGSDALNKPCEVKADGKKLSGSAAQNWCLLRLLPLLVGSWIKNPADNDIWQLCLQLREMVDLICAPKIHHNQVAYLKIITEVYMCSRHALFPSHALKPKHHYLLHYSDLTLHFGPLIRVWTLRFESKHSYFKECARKLHNFVHLCKTLAERHQFLQAYLCSGSLFPSAVEMVGEASEYNEKLYCGPIQEAVLAAGLAEGSLSEVPSVVYTDGWG